MTQLVRHLQLRADPSAMFSVVTFDHFCQQNSVFLPKLRVDVQGGGVWPAAGLDLAGA